jgi:hypothetical protein
MRKFWIAIVVLAALAAGSSPGSGDETAVVTLVVDFGDGFQKVFNRISWEEDLTVLAAMETVRDRPHGITFEYRGSGERAFLQSIDRQENEGTGKSKRNWLLHVNGELADRGFGVYALQPGDTATWMFDTWKDSE